MKSIIFTITGLLLTTCVLAQPLSSPGKVVLTNGQKIAIENDMAIEASFGMGMGLTSSSVSTNLLEVKSSTAENYTMSNTLTKMKLNMNSMGQPSSYDSENKGNNNEEMAKIFDDRINKPTDVLVDAKTGLVVTEKTKVKKDDTDQSNMIADMMSMFGSVSDDGLVSSAFELIPQGKKIGDSWAETVADKDMKAVKTYTLKSINGSEAALQIDIISSATNKLDFQGMEFEIKTKTKTKGEVITDINTSLVKKRTTSSDITGSFQMMGQDMPVTSTVTTNSIYK